MHVKQEEFRTTREVAREVNSILSALENGDLGKVVVTQGGKPRAVMISVEAYEQKFESRSNATTQPKRRPHPMSTDSPAYD